MGSDHSAAYGYIKKAKGVLLKSLVPGIKDFLPLKKQLMKIPKEENVRNISSIFYKMVKIVKEHYGKTNKTIGGSSKKYY